MSALRLDASKLDAILDKLSSLATKAELTEGLNSIKDDLVRVTERLDKLEPRLSKVETEISAIKTNLSVTITFYRIVSQSVMIASGAPRTLSSTIFLNKSILLWPTLKPMMAILSKTFLPT